MKIGGEHGEDQTGSRILDVRNGSTTYLWRAHVVTLRKWRIMKHTQHERAQQLAINDVRK